jgi:hypothetical protein
MCLLLPTCVVVIGCSEKAGVTLSLQQTAVTAFSVYPSSETQTWTFSYLRFTAVNDYNFFVYLVSHFAANADGHHLRARHAGAQS